MSSTMASDPASSSSKSPRLRVSTPLSSGRRPVAASMPAARSASSAANAEPTVPWPSSPTLNDVTGREVLEGLAPDDDSRLAVPAEDHRRPRHAVVVAGHRVPLRPGGRRHQHIARLRRVELHVAHDDVARLAVLAGDVTRLTTAEAVGDLRLIARAVEH